ncbi:hypothetical protein RJ639_025894 [Escallonia herrerae]|uniref:Disease resistance N-terminal domain-containing protein n=1 Tax=Escallonia herrerae TaxID=1293975 RepID=A0AA89ABX5_9ASTE|nr:hypothetical protein RJ639_025894 [Escallonia herrerae]
MERPSGNDDKRWDQAQFSASVSSFKPQSVGLGLSVTKVWLKGDLVLLGLLVVAYRNWYRIISWRSSYGEEGETFARYGRVVFIDQKLFALWQRSQENRLGVLLDTLTGVLSQEANLVLGVEDEVKSLEQELKLAHFHLIDLEEKRQDARHSQRIR